MTWLDRASVIRALLYGLLAGAFVTLVIGIPTLIIPNHWFSRMVPVRPRDYVFLALTVLLTALIAATYAMPAACALQEGKLAGGGLLSFLAVGCPVCNKIVVLAIGMSGATSYFEPLQPIIALAGLALLGYGLFIRLRAVRLALASAAV